MIAQVKRNINRLVKDSTGNASFELISDISQVIKLAARRGKFDLVEEYKIDKKFADVLDITSKLAIAAGLEALKDAGIPLVRTWKKTSTGKYLPGELALPEEMRDSTGVIFASAFPGYENLIDEISRGLAAEFSQKTIEELKAFHEELLEKISDKKTRNKLRKWIEEEFPRKLTLDNHYEFNRKFLLRVLSMGHSQFAQLVKARGPNTQVNVACSSTTFAVGLAEDWIRTGRCKRVIVIAADDISSGKSWDWFGAGFLAIGAATTKDKVEEAALPFDRRRHGMIVGMGAVGIVIESRSAAEERGVKPIVEILGTKQANSAFHATRLDVDHISSVMEEFISNVEKLHGLSRHEMAKKMIFMSHETYTPARGGSAAAEIASLRRVFGDSAEKIIITNTKGFTGHPMGAGFEEVVAIKALQEGIVPPIPNLKEPDPDLGNLNLSRGGKHDVEFALRFAAGFGSQLALALYRLVAKNDRFESEKYKQWLKKIGGSVEALYLQGKKLVMDTSPPGDLTTSVNDEFTKTARKISITQLSRAMTNPVKSATTLVEESTEKQDLITPVNQSRDDRAAKKKFESSKPEPTTPRANDEYKSRTIIQSEVIKLVAEKTGYPKEIIEPDMDLEADLGIDTVKQAELLGVIMDKYSLPRKENLNLADYPTINHVVDYITSELSKMDSTITKENVSESSSFPTPVPAFPKKQEMTPALEHSTREIKIDEIKSELIKLVAEKTGYPPEMIEPDLDLEADLGIDTVKQAELLGVLQDKYSIDLGEDLKMAQYPTIEDIARLIHSRIYSRESVSTRKSEDTIESKMPLEEKKLEKIKEHSTSTDARDLPLSIETIKKDLTNVLAEQTGYPPGMIEPDLDLEADLGIDTVKQAELLGIIAEKYGLTIDKDLRLSDYSTINDVARYVHEKLLETRSPVIKSKSLENTSQIKSSNKEESNNIVSSDVMAKKEESEPVQGIRIAPHRMKKFEMLLKKNGLYEEKKDTRTKPKQLINDATPGSRIDELDKNQIILKITRMLSEKTGYPPEMIEPDLDLEADLGIDTVKQAELIGELREEFNLPRIENLQLSDYSTIDAIAELIMEQLQKASPKKPAKESILSSTSIKDESRQGKEVFDIPRDLTKIKNKAARELIDKDLIVDVNTYPVNQWKIELMEIPLPPSEKIDLNGMKILLLGNPRKKLERTLKARLEKEGASITILDEKTIYSSAKIENGKMQAKINLDIAGMDGMMIIAPDANLISRISPSIIATTWFHLLKKIDGKNHNIKILIGISREKMTELKGKEDPMAGALDGFIKTVARERKGLVKYIESTDVDFIMNEITMIDDIVEIIDSNGRRCTLVAKKTSDVSNKRANTKTSPNKFDSNDVFVVTGGGQGITAEIIKRVAKKYKPRIALLGRTRLPENVDELLNLSPEQMAELKARMIEDLKKQGKRLTPVLIEQEWEKFMKKIRLRKNLIELESTGAIVKYYPVDITNETDTRKVLGLIKKELGDPTVVIHGAGLEQSKLIENKKEKDFRLIFSVKVDGWNNIEKSIDLSSLKKILFMTSIAGRFGNTGQVDYSAANDYLARKARILKAKGIPAVAIDWSAWSKIGMATRGSVLVVLEMAGVTPIPPRKGVEHALEILESVDEPEVIVAGELGMLLKPRNITVKIDKKRFPLIDEIEHHLDGTIVGRKTLSVENELFLDDHRINNVPVMPGVMAMEIMTELYKIYTGNEKDFVLKDVEFQKILKLHKNQPVTIEIIARKTGNDEILIKVESIFKPPLPNMPEERRTHFVGKIKSTRFEPTTRPTIQQLTKGLKINKTSIYKRFFHGPRFQVLKDAIANKNCCQAVMESEILPQISTLQNEITFNINPLAIEASLQSAGLIDLEYNNTMSLPSTIHQLYIKDPSKKIKKIHVEKINETSSHSYFNAWLYDENDELVGYVEKIGMIHVRKMQ